MHGGVILFRGSGADARRYLESDRSRADDYYLEGGTALAEFAAVDAQGRVLGELGLTADEYAEWVDWTNPLTGESMGRPRLPGDRRHGSPRFAEVVVNAPKSLSIAAALHPEVSEALDAAQRDAVAMIRSWLGQHSVTRVGQRGRQVVVPVEQLETVAVSHRTSRAGDPHRHIHLQIGTRVWAAGAWRGLDTAALFRQQGAIRALGTAVLAAHPQLAATLDAHGLTLDPATGEVAELTMWNSVLSKRAAQVARNLTRFEGEWAAAHPGQDPGPVMRSRLIAQAWDHERPHKKPSALGSEEAWLRELHDAGFTPGGPRAVLREVRSLDDLGVQQVASRALDRCAARASTWTVHDVQEQVARLVTEAGVRANPEELREFIAITTRLGVDECLSVLPPDAPRPEHVAHLTTLRVIAIETELRDRLAALAGQSAGGATLLVRDAGLDDDQVHAAAATASRTPLVVVEGAAGAGKTAMLSAAIDAAAAEGRAMRVVTPTKKAADVAAAELGVSADSVAALVHAHGFRWNSDGVWTRLMPGDTDPETQATYRGPTGTNRLVPGERVVVDEAGMLDQDTALALLTVAGEVGASVALVGDRAQLPAVGRGGVLDIAAELVPRVCDMTGVHRFTDPEYAQFTLDLRAAREIGRLFDRLNTLGLVRLHADADAMRHAIARERCDGAVIATATNDEARELNARIREERVRAGLVDDAFTVEGGDGLRIGAGDFVQTRRNDAELGVANRQTWSVRRVETDGSLWVRAASPDHPQQRTVHLPADYVAEHTQVAYASTAYGVQGVTAPESHTVLSSAMDAADVYVGLTRGRARNQLHVVATDDADARDQFLAALVRDRADRGLTDATHRAETAIAGLADNESLQIVRTELSRLARQIEHADRQTAEWQRTSAALDELMRTHKAEADAQSSLAASVHARARQVVDEVAAPLIEQATGDATVLIDARTRVHDAARLESDSRGLRKRSAKRAVALESSAYDEIEETARQRWGSIPQARENPESWADRVARAEAESDPRVILQREELDNATVAQQHLTARQAQERDALVRQITGQRTLSSPRVQAARWAERADGARRDLAALNALHITDAARLIRERAAQAEAQQVVAARNAHAAGQQRFSPDPARRPPAPELGR